MSFELSTELDQIDKDLKQQGKQYTKDAAYAFVYYPRYLIRIMLKSARKRSRQKGMDFNITKEDIVVPEYCPVLGIKIYLGTSGRTDNSPTLDRIDNTKGYVKGNVHVISGRANRIKSDATPQELMKIAKYFETIPV